MELFKKVLRQSLIIIAITIGLLTLLTERMDFPFGILIGGFTGIFNLMAIIRNVQSITGDQRITGRYIILSTFRLLILFVILFILIWKGLASPFGIITGFTIVFIIIIKEGLREANKI